MATKKLSYPWRPIKTCIFLIGINAILKHISRSYEVERIENSEGPDMEHWASKLRAFCQKYEETMRVY